MHSRQQGWGSTYRSTTKRVKKILPCDNRALYYLSPTTSSPTSVSIAPARLSARRASASPSSAAACRAARPSSGPTTLAASRSSSARRRSSTPNTTCVSSSTSSSLRPTSSMPTTPTPFWPTTSPRAYAANRSFSTPTRCSPRCQSSSVATACDVCGQKSRTSSSRAWRAAPTWPPSPCANP